MIKLELKKVANISGTPNHVLSRIKALTTSTIFEDAIIVSISSIEKFLSNYEDLSPVQKTNLLPLKEHLSKSLEELEHSTSPNISCILFTY
jgi:hypothetical protein